MVDYSREFMLKLNSREFMLKLLHWVGLEGKTLPQVAGEHFHDDVIAAKQALDELISHDLVFLLERTTGRTWHAKDRLEP